MLKKYVAMLLCIVMLLTLVACGDAKEEPDNENKNSAESENKNAEAENEENLTELPDGEGTQPYVSYEDQISLIIGNRDLWEIPTDDYYYPYNYAVTDLDLNGRLELIISVCMGTGIFTYTDVWQVNETFDGVSLCQTQYGEYDSQADLIVSEAKAYIGDDAVYYIFSDYMRNGWAWNAGYKRAYMLKEGRISELELAGYEQENFEDGTYVVTYHDLEGEEITEDEYNNYESIIFNEWQEANVTILWQMYEESEFNQMDDTALYDAFLASWEGFCVE